MTERLIQVTAPHFCAGLVLHGDFAVEAAPILRWTIGKHRDWLFTYFARKGWRVAFVPVDNEAVSS